MNRLTAEGLDAVLAGEESETLEFKTVIPHDLERIERLISAFSNTEGGRVIFGYNQEDKSIVGIPGEALERLKRKCQEPQLLDICTVYPLLADERELVVLDVKKGKKPLYVGGIAYVRRGDRVYSMLGRIRSRYLKEFIEEIQKRNRNPKSAAILKLLEERSTNPERVLEPGTELYRCRIIRDLEKLKGSKREPGFYGYGAKDSFVAPPEVTRDMRANYRYIPYLYCANNRYTALLEVRPRLGADVSVAVIEVRKELRLLDFTMQSISKRMTETKFNLFADLSMLFSKPVTAEDDILDYIPTQYVAEYAKNLGYDGIAFRSSLTPELDGRFEKDADRFNVVVFRYEKCEPTGSNLVTVTRNYMEFEQIDSDACRIDLNGTLERPLATV